jgi:sialic acid synthase SpsE
VRIGTREIGPGHQPYVIAEVSANHGGLISLAMQLIRMAKEAGADAVKLQLYDPLMLSFARGGPGKKLTSGPWAGRDLLSLYREGQTPKEWFPELFAHAKEHGIALFSSVFDEDGVDFLETLNCPAYKISSFELTNLPLIRKAASTGKPVILSTGMADWDDIDAAVVEAYPCALLHCVSAYPCPPEQANLERIDELRHCNAETIGFSDHTLGAECAIAAVAIGATIIEKHITLDRNDGGLDASFSMEPAEFSAMVKSIRNVHAALQPPKGDGEAIYRELRSQA